MADDSVSRRSGADGADDDGEEDDDVEDQTYKAAKDAVLFAIDVSPSMLQATGEDDSKIKDKDSATVAALKCAYALMQQRIISHPNDKMGILLFGTEQSKFRDDSSSSSSSGVPYPHCYLLADLDIPSANDVKRLRRIVDAEEDAQSLLKPSSEPASLANVLFCANQIFATQASNFSSRRLFLVTDNDDPHKNSKEMRSSAVVRAKDLYDLGVTIELFPISSDRNSFDRARFYDDVVYRVTSDPEAPVPLSTASKASSSGNGISLLNSLLSNVMSRAPSKRALFSNLPLQLAPNFEISVKGYTIFKRQEPKRACYIWLDGERPEIVSSSPAKQEDATSQTMARPAPEIKKSYRFGDHSVLFTPEEVKQLRVFEKDGKPVIRIIGFKPVSKLPFWANLRPSTFVYPSEEGYVGSTRTFSALQQTLLRKKRMALVWYVARRNATPVLAALMPGVEKLDPNSGEQVMPPGLWLCPLPFADDIRPNPEMHKLVRAPDILKDKMRDVVLNLQLPGARFDPARYPNPSLQWHYRVLQAMALEEDLPEQPEDKTVPKHRQIHKRVGQDVIDWGIELEKQIQAWRLDNDDGDDDAKPRPNPKTGAKRDAGTSLLSSSSSSSLLAMHPAPKKAKSDGHASGGGGGGGEVGDEQMRKHFDRNTVGKLNVAALKGWLSGKGLAVSGKKDDLVARVEGHFESKMSLD